VEKPDQGTGVEYTFRAQYEAGRKKQNSKCTQEFVSRKETWGKNVEPGRDQTPEGETGSWVQEFLVGGGGGFNSKKRATNCAKERAELGWG